MSTSQIFDEKAVVEIKTSGPTSLIINDYSSKRSKFVYNLIRPLKPKLAKDSAPEEDGTVPLDPPSSSSLGCNVREAQVGGLLEYTLIPHHQPQSTNDGLTAKRPEDAPYRMYYFAGGGFQSPPRKTHWKLCAEIAKGLVGKYLLIVISYPLAPKNTAEDSLETLHDWLQINLKKAKEDGKSIALIGDSAGGNVALSLTLWYADQLAQEKEQHKGEVKPILSTIMAISPPTDMRNSHPGREKADKGDPVLDQNMTKEVADTWRDDLPEDNADVSPLFADFDKIKQSGIQIHGAIGTYDVLGPEALEFQKKCMEYEIPGEWLQWNRQMHCFPLQQMYKIPEGQQGLAWIVDVLERNA